MQKGYHKLLYLFSNKVAKLTTILLGGFFQLILIYHNLHGYFKGNKNHLNLFWYDPVIYIWKLT